MIYSLKANNIRAAFEFVSVLVALAVAGSAADEPVRNSFSRAEATKIIAEARRIVNPGGVEPCSTVATETFFQAGGSALAAR